MADTMVGIAGELGLPQDANRTPFKDLTESTEEALKRTLEELRSVGREQEVASGSYKNTFLQGRQALQEKDIISSVLGNLKEKEFDVASFAEKLGLETAAKSQLLEKQEQILDKRSTSDLLKQILVGSLSSEITGKTTVTSDLFNYLGNLGKPNPTLQANVESGLTDDLLKGIF